VYEGESTLMESITYINFVKRVAKRAGYLEYEVKDVINKMIFVLREAMQEGSMVKLEGLGRFHIKTMPPRIVKSPILGKTMTTKPKRRVKFVASEAYEDYLNGK
jgi:nucleoid DNA-binding protein